MIQFNNPITANGNYEAIIPPSGKADVIITGNFDGGTIVTQVQNPVAPTEYSDVSGGSTTTAKTFVYEGTPGTRLRFVLSDATSPSINIFVGKVV